MELRACLQTIVNGIPGRATTLTLPPGRPWPTGPLTTQHLSNPIIHDPGNGPRVRNMRAFLNSSFSQPAWTDDPLCAEFAQREILQMLCTVLPEETALVRRLLLRPSGVCRVLISYLRPPLPAVSVVQQEPPHRARLSRLSPPVHAGRRTTRRARAPPLRADHQWALLPDLLHARRSSLANRRQGGVGPHGRGPRRRDVGVARRV